MECNLGLPDLINRFKWKLLNVVSVAARVSLFNSFFRYAWSSHDRKLVGILSCNATQGFLM